MKRMILQHSIHKKNILILTINRSAVLNAISDELLGYISATLNEYKSDDSIQAVVITGDTRSFAAGADISELQERSLSSAMEGQRSSYWKTISAFHKPLLAAVNGFCYGAGLELALMCDVIICGDNAKFALPECKLGIMPGAGGTQRLVSAVGKSLAMQMALTGDPIDAQTALRAGLVSEVSSTDACLLRTLRIAESMCNNAPLSLKMIKQVISAGDSLGQAAGLQLEQHAFWSLLNTSDKQEGVAAFLEKRPAVFRGR